MTDYPQVGDIVEWKSGPDFEVILILATTDKKFENLVWYRGLVLSSLNHRENKTGWLFGPANSYGWKVLA